MYERPDCKFYRSYFKLYALILYSVSIEIILLKKNLERLSFSLPGGSERVDLIPSHCDARTAKLPKTILYASIAVAVNCATKRV